MIAPPKGVGYSKINPVLVPTTGLAPYGRVRTASLKLLAMIYE